MEIKVCDLENHVGETLFFALDAPKDGNGDWFEEFFTTLEEASGKARYNFNHMTNREKEKRTVSVCKGVVCDDGTVHDFDDVETLEETGKVKESDILEAHREEIVDLLKKEYRDILEYDGHYESHVYMTYDGEVFAQQFQQGSNSFLRGDFFPVTMIDAPCFDYHEFLGDQEDTEEVKEEIIDSMLEYFYAEDLVEEIIENKKREEEWEC